VSLTLMAALIVMPVHSKGHWLEMLWCVGVSAAPLFFLFDDSMRTPAQIVHRMAYLPVVAPFSALVYLVVGIVHSAQALPQQYLLTSITMLILLLAVRGMRLGTLTHQWDLATLGFATSALPCLGGYVLGKYGRRHHVDKLDSLLGTFFKKAKDVGDKDVYVSAWSDRGCVSFATQ